MRKIWIICFALVTTLVAAEHVKAGGMNAAEERVLAVAQSSFEYEGKTYVAKDSYVQQMKAKFMEDDVDLTDEQASEAISNIYANVETGVKDGYLQEVSEEESEEDDVSENAETEQKAVEDPHEGQAQETTPEETAKGVSRDDFTEEMTEEETSEKEMSSEDDVNPMQTEANETEQKQITGDKKSDSVSKSRGHGIMIVIGVLLLACCGVFIVRWLKRKEKVVKYPDMDGVLNAIYEDIGGFSDVHSHILPGVDDGAQDIDEAMAMINLAYQKGIRKIFLTPHYVPGRTKRQAEELQEIFEAFYTKVREKYGEEISLYLGNEIYYRNGVVKDIEEGKALTMADTRYVLVEFNISISYSELYQAVKKMIQSSYIPIIAHYERYECLFEREDRVRELKEQGARLQMNLSSFIGKDKHSQFCRKMVREHLVHFFGTDTHDTERRPPNARRGLFALLRSGVTEHRVKIIMKRNFEYVVKDKVF